jgi:hypothetical protein
MSILELYVVLANPVKFLTISPPLETAPTSPPPPHFPENSDLQAQICDTSTQLNVCKMYLATGTCIWTRQVPRILPVCALPPGPLFQELPGLHLLVKGGEDLEAAAALPQKERLCLLVHK